MVQLAGAWPEGFVGGVQGACASGARHANGANVTCGTISALSLLNRFNVSADARVETTFYPPGFLENGQGLSGTARLYGDVEYRGQGLNRNAGSFYGCVDTATASEAITDVTLPPPYTWRP